jgi:hypothetical protein
MKSEAKPKEVIWLCQSLGVMGEVRNDLFCFSVLTSGSKEPAWLCIWLVYSVIWFMSQSCGIRKVMGLNSLLRTHISFALNFSFYFSELEI